MKKAISLLLTFATLLSCCAMFFACNDDPEGTEGVKTLANSSATVIDISTAGLAAGENRGDEATVKWDLSRSDAASRILSLSLAKKGLDDYKEVTFWMNNTSDTPFKFTFFFVMEDGSKVRAQTETDNPYIVRLTNNGMLNKVDMIKVNTLNANPGWHQYTIPLDEVEPLSGQNRIEYTYDEKSKKSEVKFDKSAIVGIEINAANTNVTKNVSVYVGSVKANSNKYGTMKGFAIDKISNAVCFYKESNFYLYNQLRYCLVDDEMQKVDEANDSLYTPIAVLAEHRGATITTNTKEKVTFIYKGETFEFTAGQSFTYVADQGSKFAGSTITGTTSSIGEYLTIPMEVAAAALGYQLYYNNGFAMFSDRPNPDENTDWENDWNNVTYVDANDGNFYEDAVDDVPGRQLGYVAQLVKLITYDYYTGADLLGDMDKLHGENSHGNLIISNEKIEELKKLYETDSIYQSWFDYLEDTFAVGSGNYTMKSPAWSMPDGERMSTGDATSTIITYAFLYRMTGNEDYAKRVVKIMEALIKIKDPVTGQKSWHPEHYLDCAGVMYQYAIGYDWCYDYISEDKALCEKLERGAWEYAYGAIMGHGELFDFWKDPANIQKIVDEVLSDDDPNTVVPHWRSCSYFYTVQNDGIYKKKEFDRCTMLGNWNAVCNTANTLIAIAFANVNSEFRAASEYILTQTVNDTTWAMTDCYAPDGGHPEGPSYWAFGTKDQVPFFLTIKSATGSYHGLNDGFGFEDSFDYTNAIGSTSVGTWNYHDAGESRLITTYHFAGAEMFGNEALAQFQFNIINKGGSTRNIWDLMFYNPEVCYENPNLELDLDWVSYKIGMATFRSDWSDGQLYCGIHGGANNAGHGQLDVGNFILEYNGTRFFLDLGSDNYVMPRYFAMPQRYWVYVNKGEGHNTLVINPTWVNQNHTACGPTQYLDMWKFDQGQRSTQHGFNYDQSFAAISQILAFRSGKTSAFAVIDMGCAYGFYDQKKNNPNGELNMVIPEGTRGLLLTENRTTVIIQDEMDLSVFGNETNTVLWMGHIVKGGVITVSEDKKAALISYNGNTLMCSIVVPEGSTVDWKFESRSADYLRETGLVLTPGEYSRDGKQKLVAVGTVGNELRLAVVCRLLSAGPHNYTWTDMADWDQFID